MPKNKNIKIYTQNRELSWLRFNERVLEEAADQNVPLLERLKFIAIFTANLDEFFMIRVAGLFDLSIMDENYYDNKSGLTAKDQLDKIFEAVRPLYEKKSQIYHDVTEDLKNYNIYSLEYKNLTKTEQVYIREYYDANIAPILSPQIVDVHHPFPFMPNKSIFIVVFLQRKSKRLMGILPVPEMLPEVIFLPGSDLRYIKTEKILYHFADKVFKKDGLIEKNCICITRNADIRFEDEAFEVDDDFRSRMVNLLHKRKRLSVVRLESSYTMSPDVLDYFCQKLNISSEQVFVSQFEMKMNYVFTLPSKLSYGQLRQLAYEKVTPPPSKSIDSSKKILPQIKETDLLLFYPFEGIGTFLQLVKEAAYDPKVISIKITIYRLSQKSKLVDYLCAASENGKDVTVVMELRARFDEHNNIDWSEKLEDAGCRILYGLENYKVHSKVCLITFKEKGAVHYITQVGTGNYNEKTAELYTDFSLITSNSGIGKDAFELFKNLSIGNLEGVYNYLLVAPFHLKNPLLHLIDRETDKGSDGRITIKINSLTDLDFINKLVEASSAGVKITLIVRGICCLLPGITDLTDNITVISVVGRFLEHSRVYSFGQGDKQQLYIASADLMTRNTERRIEVACPVLDSRTKNEINLIIEAILHDNVKGRVLQSNGIYTAKNDNKTPVDSQLYFLKEYSNKIAEKSTQSIFTQIIKRFKSKNFLLMRGDGINEL